ncbi:hypothetical protein [Rhodocaloribacter sp.]
MFTIVQHGRQHVYDENLNLTEKRMEIIFLDTQRGYEYLEKGDHIRRMNNLEYSIRMRGHFSPVDHEEARDRYRLFLKNQCLNWHTLEKYSILKVIQEIESVASHSLPGLLPKLVFMIKTTGKQEFGALYTSRRALVLPRTEVVSGIFLRFIPPAHRNMFKVLAHELFHLFSFANPDRRKKLYRIIGFEIAERVQLHPNLDRLRITNPDAHGIIPLIRVSLRKTGRPFIAALLTISRLPQYVGGKNHLRHYATSRLFEVRCEDGVWRNVIDEKKYIKGYRFEEVSGFYEKVGTNTRYFFHPDEILAENLAIILGDRAGMNGLPGDGINREILEKIISVINAQH